MTYDRGWVLINSWGQVASEIFFLLSDAEKLKAYRESLYDRFYERVPKSEGK